MISHTAIDSPVFRLVDTFVMDLMFEDDGYSLRIELFQNLESKSEYRCLFWQTETVELGVNIFDGNSFKKDEATYHILVDWAAYLSNNYSLYQASSPKNALNIVLEDLKKYLVHSSGKDR